MKEYKRVRETPARGAARVAVVTTLAQATAIPQVSQCGHVLRELPQLPRSDHVTVLCRVLDGPYGAQNKSSNVAIAPRTLHDLGSATPHTRLPPPSS